MRVVVVGAGAFGQQHLDALSRIDNVKVACVVDRSLKKARSVARRYHVEHATSSLDDVLQRPDIDAVILCTPTPLHSSQAIATLRAHKHVQIEIPVADNWSDVLRVSEVARTSDRICMVGHTRRFNPSHEWMHRQFVEGELSLHHLNVQTFFMRRTNTNALGQDRDWTDNLLWHHAAHTIDLFAYQSGERIVEAQALSGPIHRTLGIFMDMSIQLKSENGKLCTLALSFNNDGPLGSYFRYICDHGTYVARYDDLFTGSDEPVNVSNITDVTDGVELQDREFIAAIKENRQPKSSLESVLDCYKILGKLQTSLSQASSR